MLESVIAYHCGPALAGIKPSNIVSFSKKDYPDFKNQVSELNKSLNKKGIFIKIMCECEKRYLVIAYRHDKLCEHLKNKEVNNFLMSYGYPSEVSVSSYLSFLKMRLSDCNFPHEIGAFLGYPISDVVSFINHKDEGCVLVGEWKVYSNIDAAKKTFVRHKKCKNAIVKRVLCGYSLAEIFKAV